MIRLNLIKKRTLGAARMGYSESSSSSGALKADFLEIFGELPILKLIATVAITVAVTYASNWYKTKELSRLDVRVRALAAQEVQMKEQRSRYGQYQIEEKKMLSTKKLLDNKLFAIRKLKAGRGTSSSLLHDLSGATPKNLWVSSFEVRGGKVKIKGEAVDTEEISEFIGQIQKSPLIKDVTMDDIKQIKEGSRNVTRFVLDAVMR